MRNDCITLLVLSNSEVLRRGLRDVIKGHPDVAVLCESANEVDSVQLIARLNPSVVVVDFLGQDGQAFDTLRAIRASSDTRVIAFSGHREWLHVASWLDAGGSGFVCSNASEEEIVSAIRQVASGGTYISPSLRQPAGGNGDDDTMISAREREVLMLVAHGYTGGEIASQLCISRKTVETHRLRITRKLGLRTRAELVQYALEHGLLRETDSESRN